MIHYQHRQQGGHTGTKRVPNKHHLITTPIFQPQVPQILRIRIQQPNRGVQQPMVHITSIKHMFPQSIIQQHLVITFLFQIQAADGSYYFTACVVHVDEVGRRVALGLLVCDALEYGIWV
ncbi:hypothetical protein HanIR_Chr09g0421551 [Helianthus annuus]|nr:hypothetical protein HanIR_Chr09g0421551 [Helianthus annuus]